MSKDDLELDLDLYEWELVAEESDFEWEGPNGKIAGATFDENDDEWVFYYEDSDGRVEETMDYKGEPTVEQIRVAVENFLLS